MQYDSITVVVPTCNRPVFLAQALASVFESFNESVQKIVIVNNGHIPVKCLPKENKIPIEVISCSEDFAGGVRNIGLTRVGTKYVHFLDDDDMVSGSFYKNGLKLLINKPEFVGCFARRKILWEVGDNKKYVSLKESFRKKDIFSSMDFLGKDPTEPTSGYIWRTDHVRAAGGFDACLPARQDFDLYIRISRRGMIIYNQKSYFIHRKHTSERISRNSNAKREALNLIYEKVLASEEFKTLMWHQKEMVFFRFFVEFLSIGGLTKRIGYMRGVLFLGVAIVLETKTAATFLKKCSKSVIVNRVGDLNSQG